jgi:hypothetical protein
MVYEFVRKDLAWVENLVKFEVGEAVQWGGRSISGIYEVRILWVILDFVFEGHPRWTVVIDLF